MRTLSTVDIKALPRDADVLLGGITALHAQYRALLASLHQQLQTLKRMHFGASSEKLAGRSDPSGDARRAYDRARFAASRPAMRPNTADDISPLAPG